MTEPTEREIVEGIAWAGAERETRKEKLGKIEKVEGIAWAGAERETRKEKLDTVR